MNVRRLVLACLIAGLLLAAVGFVGRDSYSQPVAAASTTSQLVQPVAGMATSEQAIAVWQSRVDAQPLDYLSRTQLGAAIATSARETADLAAYAAAEAELRAALEINPSYDAATFELAAVLRAQHGFVAAGELIDGLLAQDSSELNVVALAGDIALETGDLDTAATHFDTLVAAERSAPVVSRLARLASARGDNAGAVALAEEALELSSGLAVRAHVAAFYPFQLGHYRYVVGDIEGSIEAFEAALRVAPGHPGASEKLAWVLASSGRYERAAALYEEMIDGGGAPDLHGTYADVLRLMGDPEAAQEQEALGLALAEETREDFPAERRHLAGFYFSRDADVAIELAQDDLHERQDAEAYDTLAWALFHAGRYAEAGEAIDTALAGGVRTAPVLYHAAAIASANGQLDAAREFLTEALSINPWFHPTDAADAAALADELNIGGELAAD